ncbi:hypothetical protein [Estrella lausannensis]|uniref:Ankyrin repeat-containing protein n=1 Tax=Estrella lausannensis TaxID=483423 RepID=A0A0H5DQC7_9BACT|nr:hypothetical protein [Estrella lausannensis]CRX38717.1 hypothetical protein ELAC_1381 [Estrella lausannensis]
MCYPYSSLIAPTEATGSMPVCPVFRRYPPSEDISVRLTAAIESRDFESALALIETDSHLIWLRNLGSKNPLHALANSPFSVEQIMVLSTHLLKIGYDPFIKNQEGFDYVCLLLIQGTLPVHALFGIIREILGWHTLLPESFLPIYHLLVESPAYAQSQKHELAALICSLTSDKITCGLIDAVFRSLFCTHKRNIGFSIQIAFDILLKRNLINQFKINDYQDHIGRNLIHRVLLDDTSDAISKYDAIRSLVFHGADINHTDIKGRFPLLLSMKMPIPFKDKKYLAEALLQMGAKQHVVFQGTTEPAFSGLFKKSLATESKDELSCLSVLLTGKDYYSEYFHLSLLGNLFGCDVQWELDGFSTTIIGLSIYERQISAWLEREASDFYRTLPDSTSPLYGAFCEEVRSLADDSCPISESSALFEEIKEALMEAQRVLSTAFTLGRHGRGPLLEAINSPSTVGFVATLAVDKENYHDIGLLFKDSTVYLCNKGFGSLQHGISEHPFPNPNKKARLIFDLTSGKNLLEIIGRHFPERSLFIKNDSIMILSQHQQIANNCPVTSFSSLELAILYTELCKAYPENFKKAEYIARAISATHRNHRQLIALNQYLSHHSSPGAVPSHSELLLNLFGKSLLSNKKWAVAKTIEDWAQKHSTALADCIHFAIGTVAASKSP